MFNNKQRFSIKKYSVGVISVFLGFSFVAPNVNNAAASEIVSKEHQQLESNLIEYNYLDYSELTAAQKKSIIQATPDVVSCNDEVYYLVYKPTNRENKVLPTTGTKLDLSYLFGGISLLVLAFVLSKNKKKFVTSAIVITTLGTAVSYPAEAFVKNSVLANYNKQFSADCGDELPNPVIEIPGYTYVGYYKVKKDNVEKVENITKANNHLNISTKLTNAKDIEVSLVPNEAPELQLPVVEIEKVPSEAPEVDLPIAEIEKVPSEAPEVDLPIAEIEKVPSEAPVVDLPIAEIEKVPSEAPVVDLPIAEIEKVPSEAPVVDLPIAEIEKVPSEAPVVDLPTANVEIEEIPFEVIEQPDANIPLDEKKISVPGQNGIKEKIIVDGKEVSSIIKKSPVSEVVSVGTKVIENKPEVTTEIINENISIPFITEYRENNNILSGEEKEVQSGENGTKVVTYKVIKENGVEKIKEAISEEVLHQPVSRVIERGTKVVTTEEEVERKELPYTTRYEDNAELLQGETRTKVAGVKGEEVITYRITKENGQVVNREEISRVVKDPVTEVIERGTKEVSIPVRTEEKNEEVLTYTTKRVEDPTLSIGSEEVQQSGVNGKIVTTYRITTVDGKEVSREVIKTERVEPTEEIIKVGTRQELNWSQLETLVSEAPEIKNTPVYSLDTEEDKTNYNSKIQQGQELLNQRALATSNNVTQSQIDRTVELIEEAKRKLDGVQKEKPVLTITNLFEDDLAKKAVVTYNLTDPSSSYVSAIAKVYDGDKLVKEVNISNINNAVDLSGLDYFKPYTLKTVMNYNLGSGNVSEVISDVRPFELELKKIEFKDVDAVELYKYENGTLIKQSSLSAVPGDLNNYVVKIQSDIYKEVMLPVAEIIPTTANGEKAYEVKVAFNELVQDNGHGYKDDFKFKLEHRVLAPNTFTSFKDLVSAIKANPDGTFILGADLSASEVSLETNDTSYINVFRGKLEGSLDGKQFAISNLTKPLFGAIMNATVSNIDLKDVNINTNQTDVGSLAKEASGSTINNVAVSGDISSRKNIGGLIANAKTGTTLTDVLFNGTISSSLDSQRDGSANGGIVARLSDQKSKITKANVKANISAIGGNKGFKIGAIVGEVKSGAIVENSLAAGNVSINKTGQAAGVVGSTYQGGKVNNVVNLVKVSNGNVTHGDTAFQRADVKNVYSVEGEATGNNDKWTNWITSTEANNKITSLGLTATLADTGISPFNNKYSVDYTKLPDASPDKKIAYENMAKLTPFYNKEYIVYMGNKIASDSKLSKVNLVDVVPMIDNKVIINVNANKNNINKLMLHYADNTVEYLDIKYKEAFRNNRVADYSIAGMDIIYTPEQFLSSYDSLIARVSPNLTTINFESPEIRKVVGVEVDDIEPAGKHLDYLYLKDTFSEIKTNIRTQLQKILAADKSINTEGTIVETIIAEKIENNKEALLLGLSYLNRWYDINFGQMNTKELSVFKHDFFGNSNNSLLDTIIDLGKSGYDNLVAKNNVTTYDRSLAQSKGVSGLFNYLDKYRNLFLPNKNNNEWLKENSKAYIVEKQSTIDEIKVKQEAAYGNRNDKYSLGVYDKITSDDWKFQNMLLPLLTMKEESVYVISNYYTVSIGGYERYIGDDTKGQDIKNYIRDKVDLAAERQRDYADWWYRMLHPEFKEKLFSKVLNYDGFRYSNYPTKGFTWRTLTADDSSIQEFFGPVGKYYKDNDSGAYADGSSVHFVHDRILDQYGTSVYTHEMVHNSDGGIYFEGNGRRQNYGAEYFAKGLLQAVINPNDSIIGVNYYLKSDPNDPNRLQAANPVERFKNIDDTNQYFHGMFDVLYLLDALEAELIVNQDIEFKKAWLRKIEHVITPGSFTAANRIRPLTDAEASKLLTLNDLIDNDIIAKRTYPDNETLKTNWYYTINMFAPHYAGLQNTDGLPGDITFRRNAFEMWGEKGYFDGFIPYVTNKYGDEAYADGDKFYSKWSGKEIGFVDDSRIIKNVFEGKYANFAEFKKAMFQERINKSQNIKPIRFNYKFTSDKGPEKEIAINTIEDLRRLMKEALENDKTKLIKSVNNASLSSVQLLKQRVYNAYLRTTDDFKKSIFK